MIRNPTTLYDAGGFNPYPQGTPFLQALAEAPDPDVDGITRDEPSTATLLLGYGSGSALERVIIYLRAHATLELGGTLPVNVILLDGATPLHAFQIDVGDGMTTFALAHQFATPYNTQQDLRVSLSTSNFGFSSERRALNWLDISMLVLDLITSDGGGGGGGGGQPPLYRRTDLIPAHGSLAPYWYLIIETNDSASVPMPKGFLFVASESLRYDAAAKQLILPPFPRTTRNYLFFALLREGAP